jgi:LemA protein
MVTALVVLLGLIVFIVIIIALYIFSTQRSLVTLDENCKNALGQIEVQLNSRWDALMAMAKTASAYAKHESETLINVIAQRRQTPIVTAADVASQEGELSSVFSRLMAISEAYPNLKADGMFLKTMDSIKGYEENVRLSRMVYNDTATRMNRMVRQWPSSFVANMLGFGQKDYLTVDEAQKKSMPDLFPNQ